jgi:drug/metabolite transporter (DMT)-like permease
LQPAVFWLGISAALGYAIAALFIKAALERGCSAGSVNFYCNLVMALMMQGLLFFGVQSGWWQYLWMPAICGLTFYIGQVFTFGSLARCEVGVATPILGAKVVFVVLFLSLFGGTLLGWRWWTAAALCSLGVILVSARPGFLREAGVHSMGALAALGAAASFGLTDSLFQLWVPNLGVGAFASAMFIFMAIISTGHSILKEHKIASLPPKGARLFAWVGLFLISAQSMLVALAIGLYEDAPGTNIIYGSRAVLGVLLAAAVTKFFSASSGTLVHDWSFTRKLTGSILVFAAIAIVLL